MTTEYDCADHVWLNNLYDLKIKWCRAYGKEYFSAGILSSQRSESCNRSISDNVSKSTKLCDFYWTFCGVVNNWRSRDRKDDSDCYVGKVEPHLQIDILENASKVYTNTAFRKFQKEFLKGMG